MGGVELRAAGHGQGLCFLLGQFKCKRRIFPKNYSMEKRELLSTLVFTKYLIPLSSELLYFDSPIYCGKEAESRELYSLPSLGPEGAPCCHEQHGGYGQNQLKQSKKEMQRFSIFCGSRASYLQVLGVSVNQPSENHLSIQLRVMLWKYEQTCAGQKPPPPPDKHPHVGASGGKKPSQRQCIL